MAWSCWPPRPAPPWPPSSPACRSRPRPCRPGSNKARPSASGGCNWARPNRPPPRRASVWPRPDRPRLMPHPACAAWPTASRPRPCNRCSSRPCRPRPRCRPACRPWPTCRPSTSTPARKSCRPIAWPWPWPSARPGRRNSNGRCCRPSSTAPISSVPPTPAMPAGAMPWACGARAWPNRPDARPNWPPSNTRPGSRPTSRPPCNSRPRRCSRRWPGRNRPSPKPMPPCRPPRPACSSAWPGAAWRSGASTGRLPRAAMPSGRACRPKPSACASWRPRPPASSAANSKACKATAADKQQLLAQEQRIQSLESHRQHLQPGEACPLCGSPDHPAVAAYQALDVSATQAALQAAEQALDQVRAEGEAAREALASTQASLNAWVQEQQGTQAEAEQARADWQQACEALGLEPQARPDWAAADALAQAVDHAGQDVAAALHTLQQAEAAEAVLQAAQQRAHTQAQAQQAAQAQLALLNQSLQAAAQSQAALAAAVQQHSEALAHHREALAATLAEDGFELPEPAQAEAWLQARSAEWQQWQHNQARRQALATELSRQQALCEAAQAEQARWAERWQALQPELPEPQGGLFDAPADASPMGVPEPAPSLATMGAEVDRLSRERAAVQGRLTQLQQALAEQQASLARAEATWQAALRASPFADAQAYAEALLPAAEREHLQALQARLAQALHQAQAVHEAALQQHGALLAQALSEASLAELDASLAEQSLQLDELRQQVGAQQALLRDDDQRRQSQQALLQHLDAQAAESELWQRLDGLIGSAKGDKFRRFAQGLTLDHLLHLANRQLQRLHGRYQLRRKGTGELELDVVDTWQGDTARDTRTLSGGESFLVSLALALALSDLVSHKTSIDSLFLDEGFGTLDADTLEVALSALDTLNASGKMIGVISHVEGLKDRISAQIRVEKGGGVGHSRLRV